MVENRLFIHCDCEPDYSLSGEFSLVGEGTNIYLTCEKCGPVYDLKKCVKNQEEKSLVENRVKSLMKKRTSIDVEIEKRRNDLASLEEEFENISREILSLKFDIHPGDKVISVYGNKFVVSKISPHPFFIERNCNPVVFGRKVGKDGTLSRKEVLIPNYTKEE